MTTRKKKEDGAEGERNNALSAAQRDGETQFQATARALVAPDFHHGQTVAQLFSGQLKDTGFAPGLGDYADAIGSTAAKAELGELAFASRMLAAQAVTLDSIFAEMARRMAMTWASIWEQPKSMPGLP